MPALRPRIKLSSCTGPQRGGREKAWWQECVESFLRKQAPAFAPPSSALESAERSIVPSITRCSARIWISKHVFNCLIIDCLPNNTTASPLYLSQSAPKCVQRAAWCSWPLRHNSPHAPRVRCQPAARTPMPCVRNTLAHARVRPDVHESRVPNGTRTSFLPSVRNQQNGIWRQAICQTGADGGTLCMQRRVIVCNKCNKTTTCECCCCYRVTSACQQQQQQQCVMLRFLPFRARAESAGMPGAKVEVVQGKVKRLLYVVQSNYTRCHKKRENNSNQSIARWAERWSAQWSRGAAGSQPTPLCPGRGPHMSTGRTELDCY